MSLSLSLSPPLKRLVVNSIQYSEVGMRWTGQSNMCSLFRARPSYLSTCIHRCLSRPADTIGALPSPLGKRKLDTYKELGRAAAAQMKYLAIADCDPVPKRGKGEGGVGSEGGFVVYRRGDVAVSSCVQCCSKDGTRNCENRARSS